MIGKSLVIKSRAKNNFSRQTFENELHVSELLFSSKEVWLGIQEFFADKSVLDIKYYHPGSQNNNHFYLFNDKLDYVLVNHFAESETTKNNVDRYLPDPLIALLTKKLSYQKADKYMKKLSNILWSIPNTIRID